MSSIDIKKYLYVSFNKDWENEKKYKYGFTKNPIDRITNSHEQHSYISYYISLYEIKETDKYSLIYTEYDKIISKLGRKPNSFKYLSEISKHLVNNGGSTEFIYESGLEILDNILLKEFNILGLEVKKVNIDEINIINKTIKTNIINKKNDTTINLPKIKIKKI